MHYFEDINSNVSIKIESYCEKIQTEVGIRFGRISFRKLKIDSNKFGRNWTISGLKKNLVKNCMKNANESL